MNQPSVPNPQPKYGLGQQVPGYEGRPNTIVGMRYSNAWRIWEYQLAYWNGRAWVDKYDQPIDFHGWTDESIIINRINRYGLPTLTPEEILRNEG